MYVATGTVVVIVAQILGLACHTIECDGLINPLKMENHVDLQRYYLIGGEQ